MTKFNAETSSSRIATARQHEEPLSTNIMVPPKMFLSLSFLRSLTAVRSNRMCNRFLTRTVLRVHLFTKSAEFQDFPTGRKDFFFVIQNAFLD